MIAVRLTRAGFLSVWTVVLAVVVALVVVAPASAQSPWWQLSSAARPTYLHSGAATDEVQELVVKTEEFGLNGGNVQAAAFELSARVRNLPLSVGAFATEPVAAEFGLTPVTAANLQTALEGVYGEGGALVSESPAGSDRFVVRSPDQGVPALETASLGVGHAEPRVLSEGHSDGEVVVTAENLGDAPALGSSVPVRITDVLPHGLRAVAVSGLKPAFDGVNGRVPIPCSLKTLSCTVTGAPGEYAAKLETYEALEMRISVVDEGGVSGERNEATVSGGGAPPASNSSALTFSGAPVPFGVREYSLTAEAEGGAPVTQAGAHPFQLTTSFSLNQDADRQPVQGYPEVDPAGLAKDVNFIWPAGLIGNPSAIPHCSLAQFLKDVDGLENECAAATAVGVANVTAFEPASFGMLTFTMPLFNLEPAVGEPARFGFFVPTAQVPVVIDTALRTGGDYGVTVKVHNISQTAAFLGSTVTVWGVPGDPRHDAARGWGCLFQPRGYEPRPPCSAQGEQKPPPFLSLPVSCPGTPLTTTVQASTWAEPGVLQSAPGLGLPTLDGCNRLPFDASIKVAPDGQQASTPTGLSVDVHVPQDANLNGAGDSSSYIKEIAVALPEGVALNPAGADGLQACSEGQVGYLPGESTPPEDLHFTPTIGGGFCPAASKVGTVKIKTPLLPDPLEGAVYLATQNENPFGSLVAMYVVAEDPVSGSIVKLPGEVSLDPVSGRVSATFKDTPQLAFEDAELHFFGGERAPLVTPASCGTYSTDATFVPWSGGAPVHSSSSFQVTSGPHGGACPNGLPFAPSLTAGTTNIQAGGFSALNTTISREDGNQDIKAVALHFPPGLSGLLSSVKLCGEAQANAGTCGAESQIGETIVSVGLGGDPFSVRGGKVYVTGPYAGAPFGLSIVNPAVAGPFNLGNVVVRARIEVDRHTSALTITTDGSGPYAIPRILDGIPLEIKHVNVLVNRPGFTFNPTNCNPMQVTGSISSQQGASAAVAMPFQVTDCATLKFAPQFSVSTSGKTSRARGASLSVKLSYPKAAFGSQANIARVKVDLPKQLPSRLTTLQKACTAAQFAASPAGCPAASIVGHAKVTTPLLPVPLEGPAYFVSNGGEAFPNLTIVLQGDNVTVDLVGSTFIDPRSGITSSTFKTVPDVPFSTFELNLPEGKYSALAANANLCTQKLAMPTEFLAQNHAVIHQSTPIRVTGCAKQKTTQQKLTLALQACHKRAKGKRAGCERQARKKYTTTKKKKK